MTSPIPLPRATPASQGVNVEAIADFAREADAAGAGLHSLMVLRHGNVVAEAWWAPYRSNLRHTMFSVSKSFTSTAVGLAIDEGLLKLDEPILSVFPTYATAAHRRNVGDMTIRHLLTMSTGHEDDTMAIMRALPESDWLDVFLGVPVVFPPGEHFLYNSGASYVLAAAVTARTGQHLLDYLRPRLFEPLGMETPPWAESPTGIALGGSGLRLFTEDLARLGQLYLQKGRWNDQQVIAQEWVETATSYQVANSSAAPDWNVGYGFQFWQSTHNSYRADGAYGQFSLVLPEHDAVVAITAGVKENWKIPPLVWEHLLPAFTNSTELTELEPTTARNTLGELSVLSPTFLDTVPALAGEVTDRRYALPTNTLGLAAVTVILQDDAIRLDLLRTDGSTETLVGGLDEWTVGSTSLWPYDESIERTATASRAGWTGAQTLEIHEQCTETAFRRVWSFAFPTGVPSTLTIGLDLGFWSDRQEVLDLRES